MIIIIIIYYFESFSQQRWPMFFHWNLSDSKSPQVSWTLLGILADLSNAVIWMVSTCPLISKSSNPFTNPLEIVPNAPITNGITVTFMFHSFFCSLARSRYLSLFSSFLKKNFSMDCQNDKILYSAGSLFFFFFVGYHLVWSSGWD